jgi:hypothetical protein
LYHDEGEKKTQQTQINNRKLSHCIKLRLGKEKKEVFLVLKAKRTSDNSMLAMKPGQFHFSSVVVAGEKKIILV